MLKVLPFFGVLFASLGLFVLKAPHLELSSRIASGRLDARALPVIEFTPRRFHEATTSLSCGELTFELPVRAGIMPSPKHARLGVALELDGLSCHVQPPRYPLDDDDLGTRIPEAPLVRTDINSLGAVCASSERDLSFWMSASDVDLLQQRLEVRPLVCWCAERVEIVRGETLSGLLLIWESRGQARIILEYTSFDYQMQGEVAMWADVPSEKVLDTARAIVSTMRLELGRHDRVRSEFH